MNRVLLIGNSHAAAFKTGWTQIFDEYPDTEMDFFVFQGAMFWNFQFDPVSKDFGVLASGDIKKRFLDMIVKLNGTISVNMSDYDQILVVGHQNGFRETLKLVYDFSLDGLRENESGPYLSEHALQAFIDDLACKNIPKWQFEALCPKPVVYFPAPRLADSLEDDTSALAKHQHGKALVKDPRGLPEALEMLDSAYANILSKKGFFYQTQPPESLGVSGLTRGDLCVGASGHRDGEAFKEGDRSHMNAEYGAICLRKYFATLNELPQVEIAD